MLRYLLQFLLAERSRNYPVPGVDWQYHRLCSKCDDFGNHATVGGVNGQQHCYNCGHRSAAPILDAKRAREYVLSSYFHWVKWPILPYNWHTLDEEAKEAILRGNV